MLKSIKQIPSSIKTSFAIILSALIVSAFIFINSTKSKVSNSQASPKDKSEETQNRLVPDNISEEIYQITNEYRKSNSLNELIISEKLESSALQKAEDMIEKNYWSHYGPNEESPWQFMTEKEYYYTYAGENLAAQFFNANAIMTAWKASPKHDENLKNPNYTEMGLSYICNVEFQGAENNRVYVMHYGNPVVITQEEIQRWETLLTDNTKNRNDWANWVGQRYVDNKDFQKYIANFDRLIEINEQIISGAKEGRWYNEIITEYNELLATINDTYNRFNQTYNQIIAEQQAANKEKALQEWNAYLSQCMDGWTEIEVKYGLDYSAEKQECQSVYNENVAKL